MNKGVLSIAFVLSLGLLSGQNKISIKNGNWADPTLWSPNGVPVATDNVTIAAAHQVAINSNVNCNNLTIGTGGNARLYFSGNAARTLNVFGLLTNNGTFNQLATSNAVHTVVVQGNLVNNNILNFNTDNNSKIYTRFNNTTIDQNLSGNGATCVFSQIEVTKGTQARVLTVSAASFSVPSTFLVLNSGTFKFTAPGTRTLVPTTATYALPLNAGIWLDSPNTTVSYSSAVTLSGMIRITNGNMDIGNANNEDLITSGGRLIVEGGTLDIAGKYLASTGSATTFSMTGGTLKVPAVATSNTGVAPFQLTVSSSTFVMSGGTILLRREGGNGNQDLGYVNTGSTVNTVTGGTLQLGDATTPASQTISINSAAPIANLFVGSANVTVKIITNPLTIVNSVSIAAGSINANAQVINVSGNWSNAGTFVPSTGTVNFNGTSAQVISKPGAETFNTVNFTGAGLKTLGAPMSVSGNFSIQSGANVDVTSSNYSISLTGNFINNGTFQSRSGLVRFSGTSAQTISGSSTTEFNDITVTNSAGLGLAAPVNLKGTLLLTNGVLNTNSQAFTIVSNATGTGRVGPITGTGNLNGNVIVQRYMPGGSTGWVLMGTNQSNALTFADWDDDLYITCPNCPDGSLGGFTSIYSYDETQPGIYDAPASFVPITSITNPIVAGKGYWVYVGTSQFTTTGVTTDATGPIRKFNTTINLTRTNTGSAIDDGWNLIHNPYPCAISWTALRGSTANLDNAIYVYNADLNGGSGGYASFVNGVSSPAVGAGGVGDQIPMGQGFYVHSTGATALVAQETHKSTIDPTYLKPAVTAQPMVRLLLDGGGSMKDETVLYFENGANTGFDDLYDASKLRATDPFAPVIGIYDGSLTYQINGVQPVSGSFTTDVLVTTGYAGTHTLSANSFSTLPKGACFTMFDRATNTSFDLRNNNYVFYLSDTTQAPRFKLTITSNSLSTAQQQVSPACTSPSAGLVSVSPQSAGPWNYYWSLNGQLIKTSLNKTTADTVSGISGGSVELDVYTAGACDYAYVQVNLPEMELASAAISCSDSGYVNIPFVFTNASVNGQNYNWNFGDGVGVSQVENPLYAFTQPGNYTVRLIASSNTFCNDTAYKLLRVLEPTGIQSIFSSEKDLLVKNLGNKQFQVERIYNTSASRQLEVFNLSGLQVLSNELSNTNHVNSSLNLSDLPNGIYFIQITGDNFTENARIIVQD